MYTNVKNYGDFIFIPSWGKELNFCTSFVINFHEIAGILAKYDPQGCKFSP